MTRTSSTVPGSVQARPGSAVYVARSTIGGSVSENRGVAFAMCDTEVDGSVLITRTEGSVLIGDSLSLSDTISTGVPPEDVPKIQANQIGANLACLRNVAPPVNLGLSDTVGGVRSSQCRLL